MNLKDAYAGELVTDVLTIVHTAGDRCDPQDLPDKDFDRAMVLLSNLASKQTEDHKRAGILAIIVVLVKLRYGK